MIKSPIWLDILGGKPNILSNTLPRSGRDASTLLRLSRLIPALKYFSKNWINYFHRFSYIFLIYFMGGLGISSSCLE